MNVKTMKVVLVILLLFCLGSLIVVVGMAKEKKLYFGRQYDAYVMNQTKSISRTVKTNLDQVYYEVKSLAEDNRVQSIFVSWKLGEGTLRYQDPFNTIQQSIADCVKIQAIASDGPIIFSTVEDEINKQQIKTNIINKIRSYHALNQKPYIYFMEESGEFAAITPLSSTLESGFIAVYYRNSKLLSGLKMSPKGRLSVSYSMDNKLVLSSRSVDTNDLNKIVNYLAHPNNGTNRTIGAFSVVDGIQLVYFSKDDKYFPPSTIIIIILIIAILCLITFALFQLLSEEKVYKGINLSSFDKEVSDSEIYKKPPQSGDVIRGLVDDIEKGEGGLEPEQANKGIEEMILSNDMDLTSLHTGSFGEEKAVSEEFEFEAPKFTPETEKEAGFEPAMESTSPEGIETATENADQTDLYAPSPETELFAEQERILGGIDNTPFEEVSPAGESNFADMAEAIENVPFEAPVAETIPEMEENAVALENEIAELKEPELEEIQLSEPETTWAEIEQSPLETEKFEVPDLANLETPVDFDTSELERASEPDIISDEQIPEVQIELPEGLTSSVESMGNEVAIEKALGMEHPANHETKPIQHISDEELQKVFSEPPVKLSSISSIGDYAAVAGELAKGLNFNQYQILELKNGRFEPVSEHQLKCLISSDDPVLQRFLNHHKSLDVIDHLDESNYLKNIIASDGLENLSEVLMVPVIHHNEVAGVAIYGREKGTPEPTNFQKSELYNIGFLQEN